MNWRAVLVTLCVCALPQARAQIATVPDDLALSVALGELRYQARETSSSGGVLNTETGRLPALSVAGRWQRDAWFVDASHQLARHDVAYEGYTQIGFPLSTTTQLAIGKSAFHAGHVWQVTERGRVSLSGGIEHLQIDRRIQPALGSLPLHETLRLTRAQAGVHWTHGGDLGFTWGTGVDLLRSVRSRLTVDTYGLYDPITLQPDASTDWRSHIKAAYRWPSGLAGTILVLQESVRPGGSASRIWTQQGIPAVSVRYPGSRQSLTSLQVGFAWHF